MKNRNVLCMIALVVSSLIQSESNKTERERLAARLEGAAKNCALQAFIDERFRSGKHLSQVEIDINKRLAYHTDAFYLEGAITVSEFLQILRNKSDEGMTIKEIANDNTKTRWFHFGESDECYKIAQSVDFLEEVFSNFEKVGRGNEVIKSSMPGLDQELKKYKKH